MNCDAYSKLYILGNSKKLYAFMYTIQEERRGCYLHIVEAGMVPAFIEQKFS